jgi:hypothetical protein
MARSRTTVPAGSMIDRFRYGPGDGHLYVWPAGNEITKIRVYRIKTEGEAGPLSMILTDTGDRINLEDTARTATAMVARVDRWRSARAVGQ